MNDAEGLLKEVENFAKKLEYVKFLGTKKMTDFSIEKFGEFNILI
jgi:hypothetical protein